MSNTARTTTDNTKATLGRSAAWATLINPIKLPSKIFLKQTFIFDDSLVFNFFINVGAVNVLT